MNSDEKYLKQAIDLAAANAETLGGGPFGAVIVKDGEVIATGANSVTPDNDPTAHAEINTIRKACKAVGSFDLCGCTLYTSCEPCPMCLSASYWAHIDRIVYAANKADAADAGFDDDFIYREFALPMEKRSIKMDRILAAEGLLPFNLWKQNEKKVEY